MRMLWSSHWLQESLWARIRSGCEVWIEPEKATISTEDKEQNIGSLEKDT